MKDYNLKFFKIAKELNEEFHEELKRRKLHFRGNLNSFSLISVDKRTAEKGISGLKQKLDGEIYINQSDKLKLEPPIRDTPEKELQAWIIDYAMNNLWILPFGKNMYYLTSEIAFLNGKKKIVNDILAIDQSNNLCIIELKSFRVNKVKEQTREFEEVVNTNLPFFQELVELISGRQWNGTFRKIAIWPNIIGKIRENKYPDVEEINYTPIIGTENYLFDC